MAHDAPLAEPQSPLWLPALGAALFVLAAVAWVVSPPFTRADVAPAGAEKPAASAAPSASAAPAGSPAEVRH